LGGLFSFWFLEATKANAVCGRRVILMRCALPESQFVFFLRRKHKTACLLRLLSLSTSHRSTRIAQDARKVEEKAHAPSQAQTTQDADALKVIRYT
jgi:hypothetical protein